MSRGKESAASQKPRGSVSLIKGWMVLKHTFLLTEPTQRETADLYERY